MAMIFVAWLTSFLVGLVVAPLFAWALYGAFFVNSSSGYDIGLVFAPAFVSPVYLLLHPLIFFRLQRASSKKARAWWLALFCSVIAFALAACLLKGYWEWAG